MIKHVFSFFIKQKHATCLQHKGTSKITNKKNARGRLLKDAKLKDSKHNEFLEKFVKNDTIVIPELKQNIVNMKSQLQSLDLNSVKFKELTKEIKEKKQIIKSLNNQKKEYYLNNSEILFDYFEKKKEVSSYAEVVLHCPPL